MPRKRVGHDAVRADWTQRGYSCDLWIDPPDRIWHGVQHEADLLLALLDGAIQIELPDRTVLLESGDEIAIPAHTRFTIRHTGERRARWLHGYRANGEAAAS